MKRAFLCIAACLFFVFAARADEFHLKDGTKVVGTIVGYEGNSFRVKTSYGFALVDRSAVVSITVSKPAADEKEKTPAKTEKTKSEEAAKPEDSAKSVESKEAEPEKKPELEKKTDPSATKPSSSLPSATNAVAGTTAPTKPPVIPGTAPNSSGPAPAATASTANTTAPATAAPPATAPEPAPVKEEVQGNVYINDTYGFQMYKPPDWDLIAGARAALPGSIVAMGTGDQTTYLIIGLVPASGTLQAQIAATNERLAGSFEGYQPEKIREATVAGLPAHEYQFHGAANDKEWTGTVALIQRGENFLTILGVTSTNTDLVQMEQNVISRTIASLQFTTPNPPAN